LHTELVRSLGPLEWVLNTPSHHRAHHSRDKNWLDCNFGGVLIVFDRMFGTFRPEPPERGLNYGLVGDQGSTNPFQIAFREWRRMLRDLRQAHSLADMWRITMGRPR
jgi:sterol desaturase/sphingolipid hydroxylase (fatty acid hydroxylase superfamily)